MHPSRIQPGSFTPAATTQAKADFTDKTLQCHRFNNDGTKCNADFIWSAGEQLLHKRLGYVSTPKSCTMHKPTSRIFANDKCKHSKRGAPSECDFNQIEQWKEHQKCRLYRRGACMYGYQCKFSHAPDQPVSAHQAIMPNNHGQLAIESAKEPILWQMHLVNSDDEDYNKATISFDGELGMEVIEW